MRQAFFAAGVLAAFAFQASAGTPCATWTEHFPFPAPQPRSTHAMAYDTVRGETLVFGGVGGPARNDLWAWDGTSWTMYSPEGELPPARAAFPMVFDTARGVAVIMGSRSPGAISSETWEWNGVSWTDRSLFDPSARFGHAMAFDSVRNVTVAFGGGLDNQEGLILDGTTWEYDGNSWQLRSSEGPSPRYQHAMTFDAQRGVTVLHGGFDANTFDVSSETWEWDGNTWTLVSTGEAPAVQSHAMVYDEASRLTIMFPGGFQSESEPQPRTWAWDGTTWTVLDATELLGWRFSHRMAYDSDRDVIVLFGGQIISGEDSAPTDDTWELTVCNPAAFEVGDLNCDGIVNNFDIDPFVLALTSPAQYEVQFPNCDANLADANGDGIVNNFDIDPFVALLTG